MAIDLDAQHRARPDAPVRGLGLGGFWRDPPASWNARRAFVMPDIRATGYGLACFVILHVGYLYLEKLAIGLFFPMLWLLVAAAVLSGLVTGLVARRSVFASSLVLGIGVAACICLLHVVRSWFGLANDRGDFSSVAALAGTSAVFLVPAVLVGAAIGSSVSRAHA